MNNQDRIPSVLDQPSRLVIPTRYVLTVLGFIGFFCVYALRVNLNVALVAMVREPLGSDVTLINGTVVACPELLFKDGRNSSTPSPQRKYEGEFDWDSNMQGLVLGSFYYGYVITQIPGGLIAERYGAKWPFGIGILVTAIFSLLTPFLARWNVWALIIARAVEGLGEGVTYPAMHSLIGRWVPKHEISRTSSIIYNGTAIGTVVSLAVSGMLCDSTFLGGWPSAFYVFGFIGCIWFIFWTALVYDSPDKHPHISKEEYLYIQLGQDENMYNKTPIPWKHIFTSVPMWGLAITHFGQNWGFYTLLTELPTYMSGVLHFNLQTNGTLSAMPNLIQAFVAVVSSTVADKLLASNRLKPTTIRKIMNSIALYVPALTVLPIAFIGCQPTTIVVLLTLAVSFNGFIYSGFNVSHVDMCPEFAGTLMGITNCIANLPGFLVPSFVGWMIEDGHTLKSWGKIFIATSGIFLVSGTVFNLFCTAERQQWGNVTENSESKTAEKQPHESTSDVSEISISKL